MSGPAGALVARWRAQAMLVVLCAVDAGCSGLLGITDLVAADGAVTDTAIDDAADLPGDAGVADDAVVADDGGVASDGSAMNDVADGRSSDAQESGDAASCTDDLSYVHGGDFHISFTMKTNQPDGFIGLVNQRNVCVGVDLFWDVMLVNQHIRLELSESTDQSHYSTLVSSGAALNDNVSHNVSITRAGGVVTMMIDDRVAGSKNMNQNLGGPLPKLRVGNGVCPGVTTIREPITNACVRPN